MQAFEYASPTTLQEALGLLGSKWGETDVLAGGTDLVSMMKEYLATPKRVVNIKGVKELGGIQSSKTGRHEVFNLGSSVGYSVKQVVDSVGQLAGQPVPHVFGARRPGDSPVGRGQGKEARGSEVVQGGHYRYR